MTPGTLNHQTLELRTLVRTALAHLPHSSLVLLRVVYGLAWVMAGITKEIDKHWWSQPGVFLQQYLLEAIEKPHVMEPYRYFLKNFVLDHVLLFNYAIPVAQVTAGLLILIGLYALPSIIVCLFMHMNFILSGNMNEISLFLYTAAFVLLIGWRSARKISIDAYFRPVPAGQPARVDFEDEARSLSSTCSAISTPPTE
ncbi:TQO small subunit DoxD [Deinococcus sp. QL22]|uniref:TQO small subunit DoxD n=1 Tax=Deinococcus sp. QL22 TaxID=2939437 RepID=UPI002016F30A|nr:TQO small subunit DoxD [Deinococcus sp. QL22]UQN08064.1 hypothetical protein M1R55_18410 [Deinococcus sp. QL22]